MSAYFPDRSVFFKLPKTSPSEIMKNTVITPFQNVMLWGDK